MKNHRIDIQSKVFGGANCIPTQYRLLKILSTQPGQEASRTWQYQGQIEKMYVPIVFNY
jgi:hypothetical protein